MTVSKSTADAMNAELRGEISLEAELTRAMTALALPCARAHTGYLPVMVPQEPLPWLDDEDEEPQA